MLSLMKAQYHIFSIRAYAIHTYKVIILYTVPYTRILNVRAGQMGNAFLVLVFELGCWEKRERILFYRN